MSDFVEVFEVGPRDGLQNEPNHIPSQSKIRLVDALSQVGFRRIEVASFVSPKWVPQMADGSQVLAGITRNPEVSYAALTPNLIGYENAVAAQADEIAIFGSASEGFSQANINKSISDSLQAFAPLATKARDAGIPVRGYVSCVVECPYDGAVAPKQVADVAAALLDLGCYEVSLGDTIGRAKPKAVAAMLKAVCDVIPPSQLAGHFHDTNGAALANIDVALEFGLRVFDAAAGGLGGCPYAPGAAGNVATEAVHDHLLSSGYETGLNRSALAKAVEIAKDLRHG